MRLNLMLAVAVVVAACGPGQKAKAPAPRPAPARSADESAPPPFVPRQRDLRTFFPGSAPPQLPSYLPLYPGAKVIGGFQRPSRFGPGGSVIFTCTAQPADVIAYYEKKSAAANFVQTANAATGATLTFRARAGMSTLEVIAEPIPGGSHVQLFWAGLS